ncbi:hypothetical protein HanRHA438_Chr15g0712651 [Helianthus annuus]|nr:hypothetical protein HanRHA438_Chr15g0712651 [Helianthus annuus]
MSPLIVLRSNVCWILNPAYHSFSSCIISFGQSSDCFGCHVSQSQNITIILWNILELIVNHHHDELWIHNISIISSNDIFFHVFKNSL